MRKDSSEELLIEVKSPDRLPELSPDSLNKRCKTQENSRGLIIENYATLIAIRPV